MQEVKEEKRNHLKRLFRENLGLHSINDLVLLQRGYNSGCFGDVNNKIGSSNAGHGLFS